MSNVIDSFSGRYRFLSNFYPCDIYYQGKIWSSSEHLFQALKTDNEEEQEKVRVARTPGEAKKIGRQINLRYKWEEIKDSIMTLVLAMKFDQNPNLKRMLRATTPSHLIEGNAWHDNYWGNCVCPKCEDIKGKNMLGIILMELRWRSL